MFNPRRPAVVLKVTLVVWTLGLEGVVFASRLAASAGRKKNLDEQELLCILLVPEGMRIGITLKENHPTGFPKTSSCPKPGNSVIPS